MTPQAKNRLDNYKFVQALALIDADDPAYPVVEALAGLFGNVGWGLEGQMGTVVDVVVTALLEDPRYNPTPPEATE